MTGYSWVPIVAILCYLFLFLTFATSKKSKETVAFMGLLITMIFWAGGSFAMRALLWPSPVFWHHVSLLGMFMLMSSYYRFVLAFLEEKRNRGNILWTCFHLGLFVLNCITGIFVPEPIVTEVGGVTQFIYEYTWHIYLFAICILSCMVQMVRIVIRHCKGNNIAFQPLKPIIIGLAIMAIGHMAATLPIFHGIPIDIMSGPVNAIFIFYSLYKKRLFKISVLFSRSNYLYLALLGCGVLAYNFVPTLLKTMQDDLKMDLTFAIVITVILVFIVIALLYKVISLVFNFIFVRKEKLEQARLEKFENEINHVLNMNDILHNMTDTILEIVHLERMYVFTEQSDGDYRVEFTTNILDEKNFYFKADHPLLKHFISTGKYTSLREFERTTFARSLWESEKQVFKTLNAEMFFPIMHEKTIVGILVLPAKKDHSPYKESDLALIQSICNISGASLYSASSYERAVSDARKDKLTGLINRKFFFELLDSEFEKYKDTSLSLCLMSLDNFKIYNQLFGVPEGNVALQRVAGLLESSINETSTAARIGGKEFAIILPGYDIHSAKLLAENIASEIGKINSRQNQKVTAQLTVSAGICASPYMASSAKELFQNAEAAVYTVKRNGKNAIQIYPSQIYHQDTPQYKHSSGYHENASTIYALTAAIDAKDHYTFQHSQNVAYYATELAKEAGLEADLIEIVKEAALLHDIGKIGIKEDILNKPGKLTEEEYEVMKGHVENAVNIVSHLPSLDYVIPTVISHHERYDGKGYPNHLSGEDIPVMGRVLCLADSFDAMTSARSYKPAFTKEKAMDILREEAGKQFDPKFSAIFIEMLQNNKIEVRGAKEWANE